MFNFIKFLTSTIAIVSTVISVLKEILDILQKHAEGEAVNMA